MSAQVGRRDSNKVRAKEEARMAGAMLRLPRGGGGDACTPLRKSPLKKNESREGQSPAQGIKRRAHRGGRRAKRQRLNHVHAIVLRFSLSA